METLQQASSRLHASDENASECQGELIYDVGAHEGQDTEFYLKKGFRVVAIECNPAMVEHLNRRFAKETAEGRFVLEPVAIAESPGEIEFFVNDEKPVWSTSNAEFAKRNEKLGAPSRVVKVEARRFDAIVAELGAPYYLKIDIEGADMVCLGALAHVATRPRYISIESTQSSWRKLLEEFDLLEKLGYSRFKVVSQSMVPEQKPPLEPKEGVYADHVFPKGATGLFGEEAPGEWMTREEALKIYKRIFLRYRLFGHTTLGEAILKRIGPLIGNLQYRLYPGWWDTHAKLD